MKKIFALSLLILISSCNRYWYKPMGQIFGMMPENGSPGFNLGWTHGCESGLGTQFGGAVYMTFYTWHRDVEIAKTNPSSQDIDIVRKRYKKELKGVNWNDIEDIKKNFRHYNYVFWPAHAFCRQRVLGRLHNAAMNPPIPAQERINFGNGAIGNVYKIDGRGDARWGNGFW